MTRHRSLRVVQRAARVLPRLQELKADHPFGGDRRIWASLRFVEQRPVHQKRMWRLMREHHLVVPPTLKLKAKRTPTGSKPRPTKPNEWWGSDMTKVWVEGCGWGSLVVVLDWYTKAIVGYDAGGRCTAPHGLSALDMAVNRQCPDGARGQGWSLMSAHGCQPTAIALMAACRTLGLQQAFTSDHNPKGHADTERMMRTLKGECLWLSEWTRPFELGRALADGITSDNDHDLHSALGYRPPRPCERDYHRSHSSPFVAA